MNGRGRPQVWIVSSADALLSLERRLAQHGISARRVATLDFESVDASTLRARLARWGRFDTLVVTSPRAVQAFVRPVMLEGGGLSTPPFEAWAIGRSTAEALRGLGVPRVRTPPSEGSEALVRALDRERRRSIVYPRSDRAGERLGTLLRARGHRVLDVVSYRTVPRALPPRARDAVLLGNGLVLVTSPSALSSLRASVPRPAFRSWRKRARVIAMGERTRRSARGHGFSHVENARSASAEALTAFLVKEVRHAPR